MRGLILLLGLAACFSVDINPGTPSLSMNPHWVQGRPTEVRFDWPNRESCGDDSWGCKEPDGLTFTVLGVTCNGCRFLKDPTGTTLPSSESGKFMAVAVADGSLFVSVRLRFDGNNALATVSGFARGGHEVALDVQCKTIDESEFTNAQLDGSKMLPCGATRSPTDIVVAFPRVRTSSDYLYFPFCFPWESCLSSWNEPLQPLSALVIQPAPQRWRKVSGLSSDLQTAAGFPADVRGTIELRTQLLSGVDATASFEAPAVTTQP